MWKKARVNKKGEYENDDVQQVVHKIDEISMNTSSSSQKGHSSNDVLTQALGTKEHHGRVRGVGGYVTPTNYFHSVKKTSKREDEIILENKELRRRVSELEAHIHSNLSRPLSGHGSCSKPNILEESDSMKIIKGKSKLMDKIEGKEVEEINVNDDKVELDIFKVCDRSSNKLKFLIFISY
ncbi:uncharacterized protein LOC116402905 [Cucumis sativus]|uniref:uncharacterized protein LOC116402905 n=1 Tax=Cucumis sativus TaxID=3659 RepID=UPI0012F5176F|nr:uncharacterized protein LOC116402905 [Cucumis sativus]